MIFPHYTAGKITENLLEAKFDGKNVCFHVKSVERDFAFELKIIFSIIPWTDSSLWSWSSLIVDQLLTLVMYRRRASLVWRPRCCMEKSLILSIAERDLLKQDSPYEERKIVFLSTMMPKILSWSDL